MIDHDYVIEHTELDDGTEVAVYQEEYVCDFDPRKNYDHVGRMLYFGNDYSWGDEQMDGTPRGFLEDITEDDPGRLTLALALRFSDHRYHASVCGEVELDAANGLIYITRNAFRREWPGRGAEAMTDAKKRLNAEIREYDSYLHNEVFGWQVTHPDFPHLSEACGGYVGDLTYVKTEAAEAAKRVQEGRLRELNERAEWAARGVLTC